MSATRLLLVTPLLFVVLLAACAGGSSSTPPPTETSRLQGGVELLGSMPHEDKAWTEGLLISDGILWESTGLKSQSRVRGLDRETGAVLWSASNTEGFFGEGLVRAFGRTYLLTYTEQKVYLFERDGSPSYTPLCELRRSRLGSHGNRPPLG